jgi:dephospho-CoA kinase
MILGITGTLGAGKGTVVDYLVKTRGFKHFSVRDFLNTEIDKRGLEHNRDVMLEVANNLRATRGPGYIAEQLAVQAQEYGGDSVIESIRSLGEANHLREHGALLWAVDADVHTRYERITKRQSETDKVSLEEFKEHEAREFTNTDTTKPNIKAVMEMADTVLYNDTTPEELYVQVEAALAGK